MATRVRSKPGIKMSRVKGHLIWLLRTLWEDGQQLFLMHLPFTLDELERLLQADSQAKELVSAHIAGAIVNLSIISQCMSQLDLFQPWARSFDNMVEKEAGIKQEFADRIKPWAKMMAALQDKSLSRAAKLGDPSDKRFFYPAEKRRTRENTETLRRAEQNLEKSRLSHACTTHGLNCFRWMIMLSQGWQRME